ncbi:MAG: hypothetical protein HFG54_10905 [Lachnospiraceae bacterium]|jgi:hypothetical protein|nr:hypothetical protein [Lachnospiraceae bacterium]
MFFRNLFNKPQKPENNQASKRAEPVQMQLQTEEGIISNGREVWHVKARKGKNPYDFTATCIYNDRGKWRIIEATACLEEKACKNISVSKLILHNENVCFFVDYDFCNTKKYSIITCRREGNGIRFSKQNLNNRDMEFCMDCNCGFVVNENKLYGIKRRYYCFDFMTGDVKITEMPFELNLIGAFYYNGYLYSGSCSLYDKVYRLDLTNPDRVESFDIENISIQSDSRMYSPYEWDNNNFIYKNKIYARKPGHINYLDLNVMGYYQQLEAIVFLGMTSNRYLLVRDDTDVNQTVRGYSLYDLEESQRIMLDKKRFQCEDSKDPSKKVMIVVKNVAYVGENAIFFYTKGKRVKEFFYSAIPFDELKNGTSRVVDYEINRI